MNVRHLQNLEKRVSKLETLLARFTNWQARFRQRVDDKLRWILPSGLQIRASEPQKRVVSDIPQVLIKGEWVHSPLIAMVLGSPCGETIKATFALAQAYGEHNALPKMQVEKLQEQIISYLLTHGIPLPVLPSSAELNRVFAGKKIVFQKLEFTGQFHEPPVYHLTKNTLLGVVYGFTLCAAVMATIATGTGVGGFMLYGFGFLLLREGIDRKNNHTFAEKVASIVAARGYYPEAPMPKRHLHASLLIAGLLVPSVVRIGLEASNGFFGILGQVLPSVLARVVAHTIGGLAAGISFLGALGGLDAWGVRFSAASQPSFKLPADAENIQQYRALRFTENTKPSEVHKEVKNGYHYGRHHPR